jgi:hypothetical protein
MSPSITLLYFLTALVLLVGVFSISIIFLVAKKCRNKSDNKRKTPDEEQEKLDIWAESANRLQDDYPEHD